MSRPRLEPGTAGDVEIFGLYLDGAKWRTYGKDKPQPKRWEQVERWRARCYYRGHDGVRGEVSRQIDGGRRKATVVAEATDAVNRAVAERLDRHGVIGGENMPLVEAGRQWLDLVDRPDSGLSEATRTAYRGAWSRHVDAAGSSVRGLTLAEVNRPPVLRRLLQSVADEHGTGSAKMTRSVLSGIIGQAVNDGVLAANAMRSVKPVKAKDGQSRQRRKSEDERDTERALTRAEREEILTHADTLAEAKTWHRVGRKAQTTADLLHFLAGTGVRIGEAWDLRWEDLDLDGRSVRIRGTKTQGSRRTLGLPDWLCERLRARVEREDTSGLVFPAPAADDPERPWDRSNSSRAVAAVLRSAGYGWATPHVFRRTVATLLHEAGMPLVKIADQLGHADPSMTMREYLGRTWDNADDDLSAHL
ncbi:tyrosine-type recombinase/integrase [Janibacter cremeus]|uniref:Integrase n=1 Tax=Janibacter cremeus TaxID=1285192 RepID=A0A852VQ93_9MICO|nr:site-specific integrase [Janibacter cremeus]NYF99207.1 integrase [Janibacter cremeus]